MEIDRPIRVIRRNKLNQLLADAGGAKALSSKAEKGLTDTHLIACAKGRRDIGDDLATRIEIAAGKHFGWMDTPDEHSQQKADHSGNALGLAIKVLAEALIPADDGVRGVVQALLSQLVKDPENYQHQITTLEALLHTKALSMPISTGEALKNPHSADS